MAKTALIVSATSQDGAYLARLLAREGYRVHGTSRDADGARVDGLHALGIRDAVQMHSLAPSDFRSVAQTIDRVAPDEIYNLSGQSSVALSFTQPAETMDSIIFGTLNFLEALRIGGGKARFYTAGSSECFGDIGNKPATEETAFRPQSPYGVAKGAAITLTANYRKAYGLFACSGLLFNHESPLRPERFVTRKITAAATRIANGSGERLELGDLSIRRDFGWAPDYVEAMWRMLRLEQAEDFVIASGVSHSLEEFASSAFAAVKLNWRDHVTSDPKMRRPSDIANSLGAPAKAAQVLGWRSSVGFEDIVGRMMRAEREGAKAVS